jgi:hypothetical protein
MLAVCAAVIRIYLPQIIVMLLSALLHTTMSAFLSLFKSAMAIPLG